VRDGKTQPTTSSLQEVLGSTIGLGSKRHAVGSGTPTSASTSDREEPTLHEGEMQFNDIPESDISVNEEWPILSLATIDCPTSNEPIPVSGVSQASPNKRQGPARTANHPPRYRDESFETYFQPPPRRHCRKIQRRKSTGSSDVKARVRHDLGRGDNGKLVTPTRNGRLKQIFHKDGESSLKTSSTHRKRSRTAHLQFKSTARSYTPTNRRHVGAPETVINAPLAACCRTRAPSVDTRSITAATVPGRRAAISVNKCGVINNAFIKEIRIAETAAFDGNREKKIYKYRFRRKKRQKNQRNNQEE